MKIQEKLFNTRTISVDFLSKPSYTHINIGYITARFLIKTININV